MQEETFSQIEAEQSLLRRIIEDNKRLSARAEQLMNCARSGKAKETEGETEDA